MTKWNRKQLNTTTLGGRRRGDHINNVYLDGYTGALLWRTLVITFAAIESVLLAQLFFIFIFVNLGVFYSVIIYIPRLYMCTLKILSWMSSSKSMAQNIFPHFVESPLLNKPINEAQCLVLLLLLLLARLGPKFIANLLHNIFNIIIYYHCCVLE